ncbi:MAG: InlB B-repeat-containing protein [Treponema sp.]|jgi:uncharacterized repeat protein (TIGR02543 family)|nr:InlB B-repeat-containing protein [Treponema sp.]
MKGKQVYGVLAAILLPLFTGCSMTAPETGAVSVPEGKAAVRVGIRGIDREARTVRPDVAVGSATAWKLWGKASGGTEEPTLLSEFANPANAELYLEPGTWDFALYGYKAGEDDAQLLILQGNLANKEIILDTTNDLSFMVSPVKAEDEGTVTLTVTLPADHGITRAKLWKDGAEVAELTPDGNNRVVFGPEDYAAGDYYFSVRLYKGDDLYGTVSEIVQVRSNLGSEKSYVLAKAQLNLSYAITYHFLNGGAASDVLPGSYRSTDAAITLPVLTREGYDFDGWHSDADFTSPVDGVAIPQGSTEDKTFYAQWTAASYAIAYHLNGGTNHSGNRDTYTIEDTPITLGRPTRTGYDFDGWYETSTYTGTEVATIPQGSTGNKTFYAKWTPTPYAIAYHLNGGANHSGNPGSYTIETSTITLATPTRTGYDFGGWYGTSIYTGTEVATIPQGSTGDKDFYAKWTPASYAISYHLDAAVTNTNPASYTIETDDITLVAPSWTGYQFDGWHSDAALTAKVTGVAVSQGATGDKDFYAKWKPGISITITLRTPAADPSISDTAIFVNEASTFTVGAGYDACQWYWDGTAINGATGNSYTLAANSKETGIYELSVVATTSGGEKLSSQCRVTIKAQ